MSFQRDFLTNAIKRFKNYKDFIQAMYLYKKSEEELKRPKIIIPNLPSGDNLPEYSLIDDGYEVTNWAEDLTNLDHNRNLDNIELVKQCFPHIFNEMWIQES